MEHKIKNLQDELCLQNINAEITTKTAAMPLKRHDNSEEFKKLSENLQQTQSLLKLAEQVSKQTQLLFFSYFYYFREFKKIFDFYIFFLQELDRKFKDTAAFINMKKLLDSKNGQIKILREKLKLLEIEEANLHSSDENSNGAD